MKRNTFLTYVLLLLSIAGLKAQTCDGGMVDVGGKSVLSGFAGSSQLLLTANNSSSSSDNYAYIITKNDGTVLAISSSPDLDLSGAPDGICRIYGISYTGTLDEANNQNVSEVSSDGCFNLSSNSVVVNRAPSVSGGVVSVNGSDVVNGVAGTDDLKFTADNSSLSDDEYAYIITKDDGTVLAISQSADLDLSSAPAGICRVYGISYTGTLDMANSQNVMEVRSDGKSSLSMNWVTVNRVTVWGGKVSVDGLYNISGVAGTSDLIFTAENNSSATEEYAYVITKNDATVLAISQSAELDLSIAPEGICRVYGISYTGTLDIANDQNVSEITSDSLFSLSSNWVTVNRTATLSGGMVSVNGEDTIYGVAMTDDLKFTVENSTTSETSYAYIITKDDATVLAISESADLDLSTAAAGICRVYGIAYTGTLDMANGQNVNNVTSDGDFGLSTNWITVNRKSVWGGMVSVNGSSRVSGIAGTDNLKLTAENNSSATESYAYIITKDDGTVLAISESADLDLSSAPAGTCRIYGISYTGTLDMPNNQNVSDITSDDDFSLSTNWVTVYRFASVLGGMVYTNENDTIIGAEGSEDLAFTAENSSLSTESYAYIITDNDVTVLAISTSADLDLSGAVAGTCRVYGISYTGELDMSTGGSVLNVSSDEQSSLSMNWITVIRTVEVEGGEVSVNGSDVVNGVAMTSDLIFTAETNSTSSASYAYIITKNDGTVLAISKSADLDLSSAPEGICRVYGISYVGELDMTVDIPVEDVMSDGEFELSSNWITVNRVIVWGGMVSVNGNDTLTGNVGTSELMFTVENNSSATEEYAYIITKNDGTVLAISESADLDLSVAPEGICRVYGISYTGELNTTVNIPVADVVSDDEFSLSLNWLTVIREDPTAVFPSREKEAVSVYPNPTNSTITIDSDNIKTVTVWSSEGILQFKNSASSTLDLSNLKEGLYQLEILHTNGKVSFSAIVKQ